MSLLFRVNFLSDYVKVLFLVGFVGGVLVVGLFNWFISFRILNLFWWLIVSWVFRLFSVMCLIVMLCFDRLILLRLIFSCFYFNKGWLLCLVSFNLERCILFMIISEKILLGIFLKSIFNLEFIDLVLSWSGSDFGRYGWMLVSLKCFRLRLSLFFWLLVKGVFCFFRLKVELLMLVEKLGWISIFVW